MRSGGRPLDQSLMSHRLHRALTMSQRKARRSAHQGTIQDDVETLRGNARQEVRNESVQLIHNRGDSPCTLLNETAEQRLIRLLLPPRIEFAGDAITRLVRPGLY